MDAKIILDLCGGTGAWSKPYKDAGYDVRLVTLPDNDVRDYWPPDRVHGILAAPPCTEFSLAKNGSRKRRDFAEGLTAVNACTGIIQYCRLYCGLKFWALENPAGYLRQFLGVPPFTFEQWEFGGKRRKPTDVWGVFQKA
jgi:site-specific DNA-cytosine methylase